MKFIFLFTILIFSINSNALTFAESAATTHKQSAYGYLGFTGGGVAFGADYEKQMHRTYSLGGYLKILSKDDNTAFDGTGGFAAGGFVRTHFYNRTWDMYLSPGFGVFSISSAAGKGTSFGPSMAFGMLFQYNRELAFGGEIQKIYGWFGDAKGLLKDTFLASVHYGF